MGLGMNSGSPDERQVVVTTGPPVSSLLSSFATPTCARLASCAQCLHWHLPSLTGLTSALRVQHLEVTTRSDFLSEQKVPSVMAAVRVFETWVPAAAVWWVFGTNYVLLN